MATNPVIQINRINNDQKSPIKAVYTTNLSPSTSIETKNVKPEKPKNIHKIPSQPIVSPTQTSSARATIKLNNSMEKIKYSLINTWIENGFIENMRGQIRCQLIRELKNPFKHQKNGGLKKIKSINHLSLNQRILNSIFIDYLTKYSYNYSLSIFKSEIGGELIGSLSHKDTYNQLKLNDTNSTLSIIEQLMNCNTNNYQYHETDEKEQELIAEQKRLNKLKQDLEFEISAAKKEAKYEVELSLKEERIAVKELQKQLKQQLELVGVNDSSKFKSLQSELENANKTIISLQNEINNFEKFKYSEQEQSNHFMKTVENEWKEKYEEIYKEFMNTLNKEKELECCLDEANIKLRSANREINYLEQLVMTQNNDKSVDKKEIIHQQLQKSIPIQNRLESHSKPIHHTQSFEDIKNKNDINTMLSKKYEQFELDLKRRLQIQAMLETDTRKLTYDTKEFFNHLNEQKSQTNQILNKLQKTTPTFNDDNVVNKYKMDQDENINININMNEDKFEIQKKKNRQSYIYYTLDKLREERKEMQQQIRQQLKSKIDIVDITENKDSDIEDNEMDKEYISNIQNQIVENSCIDNTTSWNEHIEKTEIESVISNNETIEEIKEEMEEEVIKENNEEINDEIEVITEQQDVIKSDEMENILPIIDEHKEQIIVEIEKEKENERISDDDIDEEERERLEREKLEEDLMDDFNDYTQSESFSGIDFLQNDFLEQYQKHIENMSNIND